MAIRSVKLHKNESYLRMKVSGIVIIPTAIKNTALKQAATALYFFEKTKKTKRPISIAGIAVLVLQKKIPLAFIVAKTRYVLHL